MANNYPELAGCCVSALDHEAYAAPTAVQAPGEVMATAGVAAHQEVPAGGAGQTADVRVAAHSVVDGEDMRQQLRPAGPADWIFRVTWVNRSQDLLGPAQAVARPAGEIEGPGVEPLGMNVSATTRNVIPARSAIVTPRMTNQRTGRMLGLFAQAGRQGRC